MGPHKRNSSFDYDEEDPTAGLMSNGSSGLSISSDRLSTPMGVRRHRRQSISRRLLAGPRRLLQACHPSPLKILLAIAVALDLYFILKSATGPTAVYAPLTLEVQRSLDWNFDRDSENVRLNRTECQAYFPDLNREIDRLLGFFSKNKLPLAPEPKPEGDRWIGTYFRARIKNGKFYIIDKEHDVFSRQEATMHAIHQAIMSSPHPVPDLEFFASLDDLPMSGAWSLTRKSEQEDIILIPDFGFWSWPEPKCGTYLEVRDRAAAMDAKTPWDQKTPKLFWKGAVKMAAEGVRGALWNETRGKSWSDVSDFHWDEKENVQKNLMSLDEHCKWKYLAQTEGNSYSGRLKYLLQCKSVIVAHEMEWIQHFHHYFKPWPPEDARPPKKLPIEAGDANYVRVDRQWTELDAVMQHLIKNPKLAQKLIENSHDTFRNRYITPAANNCYWRALFDAWATIIERDKRNYGADRWVTNRLGVGWESVALTHATDWEAH